MKHRNGTRLLMKSLLSGIWTTEDATRDCVSPSEFIKDSYCPTTFKDEWVSAISIVLRHINAQHLETNPDRVSPVVCTSFMCLM